MSYSQKVVSGGWIPVPQEMMDATGISEEDILATKQWGKVVPMMRKIGDYVLSTYLAEDPRKAMIMRWKARYCNGPNKKQKENMISPIVGFIYMIDSFKNHRGPDELGQERNHWRKRLLAQINCKTTWKRAHTALAKIIHNRMNMADSNPGKQQMWMMREIYRRPDVPWSVADYGNLGYPDDEDEETSLIDPSGEATLEKIESEKPTIVNKKPKLLEVPPPPSSPAPSPPPPGTVTLQSAITAQKAEGNYPDPAAAGPSGDDDDDDDAAGPSHDSDSDSGDEVAVSSYPSSKPPGQPPSAAAFVMRPNDIPSDDDDDDDMVDADPPPYSAPSPPKKPTGFTTNGYKEEDEKPGPVNATVSDYPGTPPSGPAPGNVIAAVQVPSVGQDTGADLLDLPPPYPPPTPPPDPTAIPVSSSPTPPQDPDSIAVSASSPPKSPPQDPNALAYPIADPSDVAPSDKDLITDGVRPPPPPPSSESIRIAELEAEIKKIRDQLSEKEGQVVLMQSEQDKIEQDRKTLQALTEEQHTLITKQAAQMEAYEKQSQEWAQTKANLEKARSELEDALAEVRDDFAKQESENEKAMDEMNKTIDDLKSDRWLLQSKLLAADEKNNSLSHKFEEMKKRNAELAKTISEAAPNSSELDALHSQAKQLNEQIEDLTTKLRKAESERDQAASELAASKQRITAAEERKKKLIDEIKNLKTTNMKRIRDKEAEIEKRISEQTEALQKQLAQKQVDYLSLQSVAKGKDTAIRNLENKIEELRKTNEVAMRRMEQEKDRIHQESIKEATERMEKEIRTLREANAWRSRKIGLSPMLHT